MLIEGLHECINTNIGVFEVFLDLQADRLRSSELSPRRECSVWGGGDDDHLVPSGAYGASAALRISSQTG